jgi:hypothetical protein
LKGEGQHVEADDYPLSKIMRWVGGVGFGFTMLAVALVWIGFD